VRAPTGDVGDLSWAEMSLGARLLSRALEDCDFLCFRSRRESSECSFILIERREGAISSVGWRDFERACLLLVLLPLVCAVLFASLSDSDSDDTPEEEEYAIRGRLPIPFKAGSALSPVFSSTVSS
jgi:hypothetical protein